MQELNHNSLNKNILIVSTSLSNRGGVASVVRNYLHWSQTSKFRCYTIASHVDGPNFMKILYFLFAIFLSVYHFFCHKIDIVHAHGGNIVSLFRKLVFLKLASFFNIKTIYHHHGGNLIKDINCLSPFFKSIINKELRKIDLIICLSERLKTELCETLPGINSKVIVNGISLPKLKNYEMEEKSNIINISFMGLIHKNKGVYDLIKVVKMLYINDYNVRLMICGSGEEDILKNRIKDANIENIVRYYGYLTGRMKDKFFRNSDIFVLPSYSEAMPVVILEAMSYAIPIVSTTVGAIPEIINNDKNGYLNPPGDLYSLYNNLSKLISDPIRRKMFGQEGRLLVEKHYNKELLSLEILSVYDTI